MRPLLVLLVASAAVLAKDLHHKLYRRLTDFQELNSRKNTIYFEENKNVTVYKDLESGICYLELPGTRLFNTLPGSTKTLYISNVKLSKKLVWKLGGSKIVNFCNRFPVYIVRETKPRYQLSNLIELPEERKTKRSSHSLIEEESSYESILDLGTIVRHKRQSDNSKPYPKRYRGQTQSQYLAFQNGNSGSGAAGRAEADSSPDSSRVHVSGLSGMGQAQSQSGIGGCEDCFPTYSYSRYPVGPPSSLSPSSGRPSYAPGETHYGQPAPSSMHRIEPIQPGYPGSTPGIPGTLGQPSPPVHGIPGHPYQPVSGYQPGASGTTVVSGQLPIQSTLASVPGQPSYQLMPGSKSDVPAAGIQSPSHLGPSYPPTVSGLPPVSGTTGQQQPQHISTFQPSGASYQPGIVTQMTGTVVPRQPSYQPVTGYQPGISTQPTINGVARQPTGVSGGPAMTGQSVFQPEISNFGTPIGMPQPSSYQPLPGTSGIKAPVAQQGAQGPYVTTHGLQPGISPASISGQQPYFTIPAQQSTVPGSAAPSSIPGMPAYQQPGMIIPSVSGISVQPHSSGYQPSYQQPGIIPSSMNGIPGQSSGYQPGVTSSQIPSGQTPFQQPGLITSTVPGVSGQPHPSPYQPSGFPSTADVSGQLPYPQPGTIPSSSTSGQLQPSAYQPGTYAPPSSVGMPGQPPYPQPGLIPPQATHLPGQTQPSAYQPGISGHPGLSGQPSYQQPGIIPPSATGFSGQSLAYQPGVSGAITPAIIPGQSSYQQPGIIPSSGLLGQPQPSGYQPGISTGPAGVVSGQPGYSGYPHGLSEAAGYGGESQAETSIKKDDNETQAVASAQGKLGEGAAQAQVSGSYSGSGSFSAQAQTLDRTMGAQTQVIGGVDGATSSAQGQAGPGQTQSQVKLGSDTGSLTSAAQSQGWGHGTNTQVQAGSLGGMADAQAKGQGSTSSQAQIGFTPYQNNGNNEQKRPFRGGGSASAQSGSFSGQTQTQIQGSFKYGVSYTGAAQAGSGSTDASLASHINPNSSWRPFGTPIESSIPKLHLQGNQRTDSGSESPQTDVTSVSGNTVVLPQARQFSATTTKSSNGNYSRNNLFRAENNQHGITGIDRQTSPSGHYSNHNSNFQNVNLPSNNGNTKMKNHTSFSNEEGLFSQLDDEGSGDYDEESEEVSSRSNEHIPKTLSTYHGSVTLNSKENRTLVANTNGPTQTQHIHLGSVGNRGVHIIQDSSNSLSNGQLLQPGQTIPGAPNQVIPQGLRGRVTSISGNLGSTFASAPPEGQSQSQTVVITPGAGNITYINPRGNRQSISNGQNRRLGSSQENSIATTRNGGNTPSLNRRNGISYSPTVSNQNTVPSKARSGDFPAGSDSFVSVTKSETGKIDDDKISRNGNDGKKYSHTYYTKSSTCGYFTFSCNIVYGSNGRTKICKPNPPTNSDGSPCF